MSLFTKYDKKLEQRMSKNYSICITNYYSHFFRSVCMTIFCNYFLLHIQWSSTSNSNMNSQCITSHWSDSELLVQPCNINTGPISVMIIKERTINVFMNVCVCVGVCACVHKCTCVSYFPILFKIVIQNYFLLFFYSKPLHFNLSFVQKSKCLSLYHMIQSCVNL